MFRAEKGGNPDIVRDSERKRGRDSSTVDKIIEVDEKWRACQFEQEQTKKDLNALNKQIAQTKKTDAQADMTVRLYSELHIHSQLRFS